MNLNLLDISWFLALEFRERDCIRLFSPNELLGIKIDKARFIHILKNCLFYLSILIGILNRCKRYDFSLPDFLKILKYYILPISTHHTNHLINLFLRKLLSKALQKERNIIERQHSIFIDIYHLECLSYLLIRIQLAIYLIACCIILVGVFMGYHPLGFICFLLLFCWGI